MLRLNRFTAGDSSREAGGQNNERRGRGSVKVTAESGCKRSSETSSFIIRNCKNKKKKEKKVIAVIQTTLL